MRPGLTPSPSLHKAGYDLSPRAGDIRGIIILLWTLLGSITTGVILQETGADLVSTSITGDGSVMSSSTWLSGDAIITGSIFGTGLTSIERETETRISPISLLIARSDGPLLIGEYASVEQKSREQPIACVFGNTTSQVHRAEFSSSGILQRGNYSRMQTMQPLERYITADGKGMIDLNHRLYGNESLSGRTMITGNLSLAEHIRMDQGDSP